MKLQIYLKFQVKLQIELKFQVSFKLSAIWHLIFLLKYSSRLKNVLFF
jgi:hypothetical protein